MLRPASAARLARLPQHPKVVVALQEVIDLLRLHTVAALRVDEVQLSGVPLGGVLGNLVEHEAPHHLIAT